MNRLMRRQKHKLIKAPKGIKSPFANLIMNNNQKTYACICNQGWLSISSKAPIEAFNMHVSQMRGTN